MAAVMSLHTEKCCRLLSAHATSTRCILHLLQQRPPTARYSTTVSDPYSIACFNA